MPARLSGQTSISRYREDFHKIQEIGHGYFSRVFKVLKRIELDVVSAFPLATTSSTFPESVSDYFGLQDLLSPEDTALRKHVCGVMEKYVAPVMTKVGLAVNCLTTYEALVE
ncbi:hypothetical protein M758_UG124700 [Ceratodon purpureus]|nr:hypothetical protein M758_UG124700 [Ceratodon purpureus]